MADRTPVPQVPLADHWSKPVPESGTRKRNRASASPGRLKALAAEVADVYARFLSAAVELSPAETALAEAALPGPLQASTVALLSTMRGVK